MEPSSESGQILIEGLVALLFFLGLAMIVHLLIQTEHKRLTKQQHYKNYSLESERKNADPKFKN